MKYFLQKLKDVGLSMLPILVVVLVLHFSLAHFQTSLLIKFLISLFVITIGEILFLTGVDSSIMKMGDLVGSSVNKFSKLVVILLFAFIFGLFATVAEPDVSVLTNQITAAKILNINKFLIIFTIGAGVGIFVSFALFRIIKSINYKFVVLTLVLSAMVISIFVPESLIAVAFDSGGATTGIITSPFLLALSAGIVKNKKTFNNSDNFGVIGIASLGPIIAMLLLSLITLGRGNTAEVAASLDINIFLNTLIDATLAVLPLVLVFFIFDICFLKTSKKTKKSLVLGSIITFVGLYLFLFGIDYGMLKMGEAVGLFLAESSDILVVVVALIIGFLITFTEPSVRVLGAQVEDITMGNIRRQLVTLAVAISMMAAVCLSVLKILFNISILWIILIGYGLILILMPFSSSTFVSIAFDSGGVASGPMSAAFVLPLMTGLASQNGGAAAGFGLIAIVAMMPILIIEILGIVYKAKVDAQSKQAYKKALRISYGIDVYSNIESLEEAYNRRKLLKELENQRLAEAAETEILEKQLDQIQKMKETDYEIKG